MRNVRRVKAGELIRPENGAKWRTSAQTITLLARSSNNKPHTTPLNKRTILQYDLAFLQCASPSGCLVVAALFLGPTCSVARDIAIPLVSVGAGVSHFQGAQSRAQLLPQQPSAATTARSRTRPSSGPRAATGGSGPPSRFATSVGAARGGLSSGSPCRHCSRSVQSTSTTSASTAAALYSFELSRSVQCRGQRTHLLDACQSALFQLGRRSHSRQWRIGHGLVALCQYEQY
jgi:hypothetical protein